MKIDLGGVLGRAFSICRRHRWLWLLGVFGGGEGLGFGFVVPTNGAFKDQHGGVSVVVVTQDQFSSFMHDWGALIIAAAVTILLLGLISFVISCVAVPASIWAGLTLDAGRPVSLRTAWREGVARFWIYVRLYLLRLLIALAVAAIAALLVALGVLILRSAGPGSLVALIPLTILMLVVFFASLLLIAFAFVWSDRLIVVLGVGAVEALRRSAWLARRSVGDTLLFAIVMGVVVGAIGIVGSLAGAVGSLPGALVLIVGASANSTLVAAVGVVLSVLIGGGLFLAVAGFAGAFLQVAYALACRDLCRHHGLQLAPDNPAPVPLSPSGLPAQPPAPA